MRWKRTLTFSLSLFDLSNFQHGSNSAFKFFSNCWTINFGFSEYKFEIETRQDAGKRGDSPPRICLLEISHPSFCFTLLFASVELAFLFQCFVFYCLTHSNQFKPSWAPCVSHVQGRIVDETITFLEGFMQVIVSPLLLNASEYDLEALDVKGTWKDEFLPLWVWNFALCSVYSPFCL